MAELGAAATQAGLGVGPVLSVKQPVPEQLATGVCVQWVCT